MLQHFNGQSLHDLESGALAVAGGGAGQQRADRLDRLAVAPDNAAYVGLAKLDPKDGRPSRRNLRKHHLIGKLDELANDELEELFHGRETTGLVHRRQARWPPRLQVCVPSELSER